MVVADAMHKVNICYSMREKSRLDRERERKANINKILLFSLSLYTVYMFPLLFYVYAIGGGLDDVDSVDLTPTEKKAFKIHYHPGTIPWTLVHSVRAS
jgi:hypothetical protein